MKTMKRISCLLLALALILALSVTAFAATVDNQTDHSYDAYQIFSGTQAANNVALGDVEWGSGINGAEFLAALKADSRFGVDTDNIFASCTSAADVAAKLGEYTDKSDVAMAFANVAAQHLTVTKVAIVENAESVDLSAGYYLLVDTTVVSDKDDAMNSALLQVTNNGSITIEEKYTVPTVDKEVQDSDDTWGEAADWNIGSDVPFTLTGTLPSNYADYETYFYQFNDTLSSGLSYNDDVKVYVMIGNTKTDVTASFSTTKGTDADGNPTLTIKCENLKNITNATIDKDSKIVVEYTAELTAAAEIGQPGNSNKVTITYSNNPNHSGDGTPSTGKTPEDTVLVFTYELDVTKVDGQNTDIKLKDAEFVLLNSDKTMVAKITDGKFVEWVAVPDADDGKITYPDGTTLTSDSDGKFVIAGLDDGNYYLREIKAPAGYNLLKDDISVTITATLNKDENNPALTALKLSVKEDKADATATESDGVLDTGVVSTDVKNNKGATLPETGGIGTTIFYVLGSVLLVGAAVLLITKKRMSAEK